MSVASRITPLSAGRRGFLIISRQIYSLRELGFKASEN